jgi:hypothetical protein
MLGFPQAGAGAATMLGTPFLLLVLVPVCAAAAGKSRAALTVSAEEKGVGAIYFWHNSRKLLGREGFVGYAGAK